MVGLDSLPRLHEVSDRLESGRIGHAPIARGELYDFDDESFGCHVNQTWTRERRGRRGEEEAKGNSWCVYYTLRRASLVSV